MDFVSWKKLRKIINVNFVKWRLVISNQWIITNMNNSVDASCTASGLAANPSNGAVASQSISQGMFKNKNQIKLSRKKTIIIWY